MPSVILRDGLASDMQPGEIGKADQVATRQLRCQPFQAGAYAGIRSEDQAPLPRPRLRFYGVIDERLGMELTRGLSRAEHPPGSP